jgi:hypothetical protein
MSRIIFAVFGGINKTEIYIYIFIYKTSVECWLISQNTTRVGSKHQNNTSVYDGVDNKT